MVPLLLPAQEPGPIRGLLAGPGCLPCALGAGCLVGNLRGVETGGATRRSPLRVRSFKAGLTSGMWARSHTGWLSGQISSLCSMLELESKLGMRTHSPTFRVLHQACPKLQSQEGRQGGSPGVFLSSTSPCPHFPLLGTAQKCRLPGPSAQWRLKTKLPGACSEACRYHSGKWSMVKTLASSSGVRNFL